MTILICIDLKPWHTSPLSLENKANCLWKSSNIKCITPRTTTKGWKKKLNWFVPKSPSQHCGTLQFRLVSPADCSRTLQPAILEAVSMATPHCGMKAKDGCLWLARQAPPSSPNTRSPTCSLARCTHTSHYSGISCAGAASPLFSRKDTEWPFFSRCLSGSSAVVDGVNQIRCRVI